MSTFQTTTSTTPVMIKRPSPPESPPRPAPGASRFRENLDDDLNANSSDFPQFWEHVDSEQRARDLFWLHLKWIYDPHPPEVQDDWIFTNEIGFPINGNESLHVNVAQIDSPMPQEYVFPEAPWKNTPVERETMPKEKKNRTCGQASMGKFLYLLKIDFESVPLPAFLLDKLSRRRSAEPPVHQDMELSVLQRPQAAPVRRNRPVSLWREDLPSQPPVSLLQTEHQYVHLTVPDQPSRTAAVHPMKTRRPGKPLRDTQPVKPAQPSRPTRPGTPIPREEELVLLRLTNVGDHRLQQHSRSKPRSALPRAEQQHSPSARDPHMPLNDQDVVDMLTHTAAVEQSNRFMLAYRNGDANCRELYVRRTPLPAPTESHTDRRDSAQEKPVEMKERVPDIRRATRQTIIAASSVGNLYDDIVVENEPAKHVIRVTPAAHRVNVTSYFSDSDSSDSDDEVVLAARPAEHRMDLCNCFSDNDWDDTTAGHEIPEVCQAARRMAVSDTSSDSECTPGDEPKRNVAEVHPEFHRMALSDCSSDSESDFFSLGSEDDSEVDCSWLGIIARHGPLSSRRPSLSCFSVGSFDGDDESDAASNVSQPSPSKNLFSDPSPAAWESYGMSNNQSAFQDPPGLRWTKEGEYTRLRHPNMTVKVPPRVDSGYAVYRSPDLDLEESLPPSPSPGHDLKVTNASTVSSSSDSDIGLEKIPFVEDPG